jgi:hypothetical protein
MESDTSRIQIQALAMTHSTQLAVASSSRAIIVQDSGMTINPEK